MRPKSFTTKYQISSIDYKYFVDSLLESKKELTEFYVKVLVPGLSSRLVVFFSHIPERGLGRWGASSGEAMAPENHIPEILLPTQAVPAAREGRNKRCAGPNHHLTTPPPNNSIRSEKGQRDRFQF